MPLEDKIDVNDKDLEPFFSIEVATELCGCTQASLEHFLFRYKADFPPRYHHDGSRHGSGKRVLFRSEIIEIRRRMLSGLVGTRIRSHNIDKKKRSPNFVRFEKPSSLFLLS